MPALNICQQTGGAVEKAPRSPAASLPRDNALGCGAYRPIQKGVAELKRMFAIPASKGVGSAVLNDLERRAKADGCRELWLETRLVNSRAVRFYERNGYRRIPNFGKYVGRPEAVCFAKTLGRESVMTA